MCWRTIWHFQYDLNDTRLDCLKPNTNAHLHYDIIPKIFTEASSHTFSHALIVMRFIKPYFVIYRRKNANNKKYTVQAATRKRRKHVRCLCLIYHFKTLSAWLEWSASVSSSSMCMSLNMISHHYVYICT